jgi:dTDP-glucose 4,6-dehydratase
VSNPLSDDLDHILKHTKGLWEELRGKRIFITGGTGFFGCWLLESLLWANRKLDLKAKATILTRNHHRFIKKVPHLAADSSISFLTGDIESFRFPRLKYSHLIHAAVENTDDFYADNKKLDTDVTVLGTRRIITFAQHCGVKKMLFTSSGAVYGRQPFDLLRIPEDFPGAPDPLDTNYHYSIPGEAKRIAESMCILACRNFGIDIKIARCFSFLGPYLPIDGKFAAGNFMRDAIYGTSIMVNGDGSAVRSYLYAADLVIWLWAIFLKGIAGRPYNVGSEKEITIRELASSVSRTINPKVSVRVLKRRRPRALPERYVPDVSRVQKELGLKQWIDLKESLRRWSNFLTDDRNRQ